MLHELTKTILLLVAGLFPIINPPASAFIVLSLVPDATAGERADLARRITINSFVILLASLSVGAYVLSFFGISIPVLRVAGGIIIGTAGWRLLESSAEDERERESRTAPDNVRAASLRAKAFYPLTLPITVGPGGIAVAIALGTGSPRAGLLPIHFAGVGAALAILSISIYVCVRFAGHVKDVLGTIGTQIAMRLFAFVIFCIGVQIFWLGLSELLTTAHLH